MNQALTQKKEATDTDKDKQYANILASVNKRQSSTDTSSTQQLIQKYGISFSTNPKQIGEILAQESINQILLEFKKSGKIAEENGKYYYGGKQFTPKQMKETIMKSYKGQIQQMINKKFENIKLELKKQTNSVKIQANNQQRQIIASNIGSLKTQLKTQEEVVEKRTEQYLSTLYKQNKALSEQRKEKAQLEANRALQMFQQDTLSGKDKQLTQGYQNQQLQLDQQRTQISIAKQQQDRHIDDLEARYQAALNEQRRHEDRQEQERQQHNEIIKQQNDIANRNDENVKRQIDAANANNAALINANTANTQAQIDANAANTQAQIDANAQLTQAQIDANKQLTQAQIDADAKNTKAIIDNQVTGTNAIVDGLNQIGANIAGINSRFDDLNKNFKDINDKILNPPFAPTPGVPPGCDPAILSQLRCSGRTWKMTPEITNARNTQGQTNINIFRCVAGGHYCASDGGYGEWSRNGLPPPGYSY